MRLFDRHARTAFIAVCLTLIASGLGFRSAVNALNVYLKKEPVELRHDLGNIPRVLGPWQAIGTDATLDEAVIESLGTEYFLTRNYAHRDDPKRRRLNVHVAYYTGMIDAVPHVPDRCAVAAGLDAVTLPINHPLDLDQASWRDDTEHRNRATGEPYRKLTFTNHFTRELVTVRMPVGEFKLRTTEFQHPAQPGLRIYAGYFFIANGRVAVRPESVRRLAFDRTDQYAYYAKIELTMYGGPELDDERYLDVASEFMNDFLPEVMLCLPDWAEVESRSEPPSDPRT